MAQWRCHEARFFASLRMTGLGASEWIRKAERKLRRYFARYMVERDGSVPNEREPEVGDLGEGTSPRM